MTLQKLFFVFLLIPQVLNAQQKEYKGVVYDQFDHRIIDATVINLRTQDSTKTDCQGRFRIMLRKGDSISIVKKNYLTYSKRIRHLKRLYVTMNFDVFKIRGELRAYEEEAKKKYPDYRPNCCQPLFIVDGELYHHSKNWDHLEPKPLRGYKVFKGADATNMFSYFANSGVIFVATKCKSD